MPSILEAAELPQQDVLRVEHLDVSFVTRANSAHVVQDVSFRVGEGECLGIVGSSGAGKSLTCLAPFGLAGPSALVSGRVQLCGEDVSHSERSNLDRVRGERVGFVFQDPMTSLTPHHTVGRQIVDALRAHRTVNSASAKQMAIDALRRVRIADPERRFDRYPHELSGGMRQRVMLAIATVCEPRLLIADEPTTALDVTVQAEILALLAQWKSERRLSIVIITHDFGVIASLADRVVVMEQGRVVESGDVKRILRAPEHPCTQRLLETMPMFEARRVRHA